MNSKHHRFSKMAVVAVAAATVGACQGGSETSQVVARVNDSEITVSQLHAALSARGVVEPTAQTTRQALEGLVNEQLLVDAALQNKLDRDPAVVQSIENARRQLLARAYLERMVFPREEITAAEQTAYYKDHPALFAQRRVYQLAAYVVDNAALTDEVVQALGSVRSPAEVAALLARNHLNAEAQALSRAAEQLPLEQLQDFAAAEVGDVIVQRATNDEATLFLITGILSSPLAFESAQPIVQQYLVNVRNAEALDLHLRQIRAGASITHLDEALLAAGPAEPSGTPGTDTSSDRLQRGAAVLN